MQLQLIMERPAFLILRRNYFQIRLSVGSGHDSRHGCTIPYLCESLGKSRQRGSRRVLNLQLDRKSRIPQTETCTHRLLRLSCIP